MCAETSNLHVADLSLLRASLVLPCAVDFKDLELSQQLGSGSFGSVWLAQYCQTTGALTVGMPTAQWRVGVRLPQLLRSQRSRPAHTYVGLPSKRLALVGSPVRTRCLPQNGCCTCVHPCSCCQDPGRRQGPRRH